MPCSSPPCRPGWRAPCPSHSSSWPWVFPNLGAGARHPSWGGGVSPTPGGPLPIAPPQAFFWSPIPQLQGHPSRVDSSLCLRPSQGLEMTGTPGPLKQAFRPPPHQTDQGLVHFIPMKSAAGRLWVLAITYKNHSLFTQTFCAACHSLWPL